jgi:hypothetical protein
MAGEPPNSSESTQPRPLVLRPSSAFARDVKRQQKRGKAIPPSFPVSSEGMISVACGQPSTFAQRSNNRIYKQEGDELKLGRTGTHADLF